jgi:hypothetical protein
MSLIPFSDSRVQSLWVGLFSGLLVSNLCIAVCVAVGGAAALVRQEERFGLLEVAPLSNSMVAALPLASVVVVSLFPLMVLFAPFVVAALRLAPMTAAAMILAAAAVVGWATLIALQLVLRLARRFGKQKGARYATAVSILLAFCALISLRSLLRLSTDSFAVLIFLVLTVLLLPKLWNATANAFVALLRHGEPPAFGREPEWGSPSWWRLLSRTSAPWAIVGVLPTIVYLALADMPLRRGTIALLLLSLSMSPLRHLLSAEFDCPERLQLAPFSGALKRSLLLEVGVPSVLTTLAVAIVVGRSNWAWVVGVAVLLVLTPLTFFLRKAVPRHSTQGALMLIAMLTEVLR